MFSWHLVSVKVVCSVVGGGDQGIWLQEGGPVKVTVKVTVEVTVKVTQEVTVEVTQEVTVEVTGEVTVKVTGEVTVKVTVQARGQ